MKLKSNWVGWRIESVVRTIAMVNGSEWGRKQMTCSLLLCTLSIVQCVGHGKDWEAIVMGYPETHNNNDITIHSHTEQDENQMTNSIGISFLTDIVLPMHERRADRSLCLPAYPVNLIAVVGLYKYVHVHMLILPSTMNFWHPSHPLRILCMHHHNNKYTPRILLIIMLKW